MVERGRVVGVQGSLQDRKGFVRPGVRAVARQRFGVEQPCGQPAEEGGLGQHGHHPAAPVTATGEIDPAQTSDDDKHAWRDHDVLERRWPALLSVRPGTAPHRQLVLLLGGGAHPSSARAVLNVPCGSLAHRHGHDDPGPGDCAGGVRGQPVGRRQDGRRCNADERDRPPDVHGNATSPVAAVLRRAGWDRR